MAGQFGGRVALITGASSGIGRATAIAFAEEGANVAVVDINAMGGKQTVDLVKKAGSEAVFIQADVAQETEVEVAVRKTVDSFGRLDFGLNIAGIPGNSELVDYSIEDWNQVININLTGVFLCMKHEIPQIIKQGGGAIVNMASMSGLVVTPTSGAYSASKFGVIGLTKSAALAYIDQNVRINCVCPGTVQTPIIDWVQSDIPETYEMLVAATPSKRIADPKEIADAILWLCSDASSYCVGHALVLDGGFTLQ